MVRKAKGKKVLALLMAAAMVASFSITAMADDTTDTPTANVTGSYAGAGGKPVFLYEYNMPETMAFKYSAPGSGVWDPNTHSYKPGTTSEGGWSSVGGDNWITVKNHSNAPITVILDFQATRSGMRFGFTDNNFVLSSAVGTDYAHAPEKRVMVGPTSDCPGLFEGDTNVQLGVVTIRIAAA